MWSAGVGCYWWPVPSNQIIMRFKGILGRQGCSGLLSLSAISRMGGVTGWKSWVPTNTHIHTHTVMLSWAGLGWAGLGWAGLGWAGLGWAGLGWTGLDWGGLGWAGLGWAGLGLGLAITW